MGKKITCLLVAVLLIAICVTSFNLKGLTSIAHAGNASDKQIKNMGDLQELVGTISGDNSKHKSTTVHISTSQRSVYTSSDSDLTSGISSKRSSTEGELTCYFTRKAAYYEYRSVSSSTITRNNAGKSGSETKTYCSFEKYDVDVYVTNKRCYIKINDYSVASDFGSKFINAEYTNKWIEMPYSLVSSLVDYEYLLDTYIKDFESMFEYLIEEDKISKKDKSVSFNENELGMEGEGDDYKAELSIDLNNATRPHISMSASYDNTEKHKFENINLTIKNKVKSATDIVISNVNNTEIDWELSGLMSDLEVETYEDLEDMFTIKEYEED